MYHNFASLMALQIPTRRPERHAAEREDLGHSALDLVHRRLHQIGRRALHGRVDGLPLRGRPRVHVGARRDLGQVPPPTAQRLHKSTRPVGVAQSPHQKNARVFFIVAEWTTDEGGYRPTRKNFPPSSIDRSQLSNT